MHALSRIDDQELILRWDHVDSTLEEMPEHERQRHWDMSQWGYINECGTVCCAAGRCGLQPWFRERGHKLDFIDGRAVISNVPAFFGLEGSDRIFHNQTQRSVETVVGEVRDYVAELRTIARLNEVRGTPPIGEPWAGQGGINAGARLGVGGMPNYYLVVGPQYDRPVSWHRASEWATELEVDGKRDFALPRRAEQRALFDRVRGLFQPAYYWSCEEHASNSGSAWLQYFGNGFQNYWRKVTSYRARAVRRLSI